MEDDFLEPVGDESEETSDAGSDLDAPSTYSCVIRYQ